MVISFYPLQKPTSRDAQSYYHVPSGKVVKGPYTEERAKELRQKYKDLASLDPHVRVPRLKEMEGPTSPIFTTEEELASGFFLEFPLYCNRIKDAEVTTEETSYGMSLVLHLPVIPVVVSNLTEEQLKELTIAACARYVLGIEDSALRNFLVYHDHIRQIDIDKNRGSTTPKTLLEAMFSRLSYQDSKILQAFIDDHQSWLRETLSAWEKGEMLLSLSFSRAEVTSKSTVAEIKEHLDALGLKYKKTSKKADLLALLPSVGQASSSSSPMASSSAIHFDHEFLRRYPSFTTFDDNESFTEVSSSPENSAGLYVTAFVALHWYCFKTSGSKLSLISLTTSVWTGLLEDISVASIRRIGPIVKELMDNLRVKTEEVFGEEDPNLHDFVVDTALKIYALYSEAPKTRELSFLRALRYHPALADLDHPFREVCASSPPDDLKLITIFGATKNLGEFSWLYDVARDHHKLRDFILLYRNYIRYIPEPQEPVIDVERFDDVTVSIFDDAPLPVPSNKYHMETTGIEDADGQPLTRAVCKSILQKAFRAGKGINKVSFEGGLSSKLKIAIGSHYLDKHVKASEDGDMVFFRTGMRSSNCADVAVGDSTLYSLAMELYCHCDTLGLRMRTSVIAAGFK
jgi:hypothetical protein